MPRISTSTRHFALLIHRGIITRRPVRTPSMCTLPHVRPKPGPAMAALLSTQRHINAFFSLCWPNVVHWSSKKSIDNYQQGMYVCIVPKIPAAASR